jgi:hypothetical protein
MSRAGNTERLTRWLLAQMTRNAADAFELARVAGSRSETLHTIPAPQDTDQAEATAVEVWSCADDEAHAAGVSCRFRIDAMRAGERVGTHAFRVAVADPSPAGTLLEEDGAGASGLLRQALRHNEVLVRLMTSSAHQREQATLQLMTVFAERATAAEEQLAEQATLMRELMTARAEADSQARMTEARADALRKLADSAPMLLGQLTRKLRLGPGKPDGDGAAEDAEQAADPSPSPMLMAVGFLRSLTHEQIDTLTDKASLDEEQATTLGQLWMLANGHGGSA